METIRVLNDRLEPVQRSEEQWQNERSWYQRELAHAGALPAAVQEALAEQDASLQNAPATGVQGPRQSPLESSRPWWRRLLGH
jgi:hypothetical protein